MAKKAKTKDQGLTASTAEWADFGFDDIFSGESQPASSSKSQSSISNGQSSPPPGSLGRDSSFNSLSKSDDKKKENKEVKKKCSVKGCKNRRFRRKYCAMHLNSEFDKEGDQESKPQN